MNDVRHNGVIIVGCVSSIILWVKFKFSVVVAYDPIKVDEVEKDMFWNDLDRLLIV